jgi:hypothetical protein
MKYQYVNMGIDYENWIKHIVEHFLLMPERERILSYCVKTNRITFTF